jgi:xylan 1,4-beta-xylosidase
MQSRGPSAGASLFEQTLVARRQQAFCYSAATRLDFASAHFQQAVGLVCYYNSARFIISTSPMTRRWDAASG